MKLLVANRSEIACRIFQAAKEMSIATVAVFAPGDEEARHVSMADQIVPISSYLDPKAIVDAAILTGAKLIHPGYGFLSERPHFADLVEKSGLNFIGPKAQAMELLGGKIASKELAAQIGVPTLPWAKVDATQDLQKVAQKIGYPLLLKASAGGGGKGMRKVYKPEELLSAAESASAEAKSAFGDGVLFLEKLVLKPRHIEVQVFGDGMGHAVHLHERECSLQRRHQKVWEEAKAPNLSDKTREGLFEAAIKLAKHVNYRSAGTVEFLVDQEQNFYFLEMNTRLQVEHPVTELVTGVDLVWAQIEQALNPKSPVLSKTPEARGHAIEVRLYAEDPAQDYFPTPGKVQFLRWPTGPGIRVDSGIEEGQTVGTGFDSMLAKVIVSAQDRNRAIARLRYALSEMAVLGLGTNQSFLRMLCDQPEVINGMVHTHYLDFDMPKFLGQPDPQKLAQAFLAPPSMQNSLQHSSEGRVFASPWTKI